MVSGNAFEVDDDISLNSRGNELTVSQNKNVLQTFTSFPATFSTGIPGMYKFEQTTDFGKSVSADVYVKIPSAESNIKMVADTMENPYKIEDENDYFYDLLIYIAAALVAFLFIEWVLHIREEA